jgi:hypothetical protein
MCVEAGVIPCEDNADEGLEDQLGFGIESEAALLGDLDEIVEEAHESHPDHEEQQEQARSRRAR